MQLVRYGSWIVVLLLLSVSGAGTAVTMTAYQNFPVPEGSNNEPVVGDAFINGKLLLWNGDKIYRQNAVGSDAFTVIAEGYIGKPGFISIAPDESLVVLGAGETGNLYSFDPQNPSDYDSDHLLRNVSHSSGRLISGTMLLVHRSYDLSGSTYSELVLFDLTNLDGGGQPIGKIVVALQNESEATGLYMDGVTVYITNGLSGQVRLFLVSAIINAYNSNTTLTWETAGVSVGQNPLDFFANTNLGGVAGYIDHLQSLILSNSDQGNQTLGLQLFDLAAGEYLEPFRVSDDAGLYKAIYNPYTRVITLLFREAGVATNPWEVYAIALLDEGEGEGEGASEGEGEGIPEGEGEGMLEGEGEGPVIPPCEDAEMVIQWPEDGATLYVDAAYPDFALEVSSAFRCTDYVIDSVDFYYEIVGVKAEQFMESVTEAPYIATVDSSLVLIPGQTVVFYARAFDGAKALAQEATSTITVEAVNDALDGDGNGLPDKPFDLLDHGGDLWLNASTLPGSAATMLSAIGRIYSTYSSTTAEVKQLSTDATQISLPMHNPAGGDQSVTLTFSRDLLQADELGLFVFQMAPTLESLVVGDTIADMRQEPVGVLGGTGQYALMSLLVTEDEGATLSLLPANRLSDTKAVSVYFSDQPILDAEVYVLAGHPVIYNYDSGGDFTTTAPTRVWSTLLTQGQDKGTGDMWGDLDEANVIIAPYRIVPGGGPCFIATAAYGTPMAEDIDVLRHFRDTVLLESYWGTALTDGYYQISPAIADGVAQNAFLAAMVRAMLVPILYSVEWIVLIPWQGGAVFALLLVLLRRRNQHRRAHG